MFQNIERQTDTPLFPDTFWNRPTLKSRGGSSLIIGGQKNAFSDVQAIYQLADAAGMGETNAIMPDVLRRMLGDSDFGYFVPSTISGSLAKSAFGEILHLSEESDGLIIGANLTNNAETGILVESLIEKSQRSMIVTDEAINILKFQPKLISDNANILVIATTLGLMTLANNLHLPITVSPRTGLGGKLEMLRSLTEHSACQYCLFDSEIIVSAGGKIGFTSLYNSVSDMPALPIGVASTFWLQQRTKSYEALMTAAFTVAQASAGKTQPTVTSAAQTVRRVLALYDQ